MVQDRDQWRALVSTIIKLGVSEILRNSLAAASYEGLGSMELCSFS
jgi:hypothetical protein